MNSTARRSNGFTVLESLVAGAIFLIAVLAVSLLAVQGSVNASRGMRFAQAARIANQEMEKLTMQRYTGIQTLVGGVSPFVIPQYTIVERPGATDGRSYKVDVTITDSSGAAPPLGPPPPPNPNIGAPSYFVNVTVTSVLPDSNGTVTVNQATYVSPDS
jgi:Tfp pilus assembly protein PilV